jgi:hypothetical protein
LDNAVVADGALFPPRVLLLAKKGGIADAAFAPRSTHLRVS